MVIGTPHAKKKYILTWALLSKTIAPKAKPSQWRILDHSKSNNYHPKHAIYKNRDSKKIRQKKIRLTMS